jgi:hypothetical protein
MADTKELPAGYVAQPQPNAPRRFPPAAATRSAEVTPPKAPVGAHGRVLGRPSFSTKQQGVLIGGSVALLCVAVGAFLWLRPGTPGVVGVGHVPPGVGSGEADVRGKGQPTPPSAPGDHPSSSENRIARSSTGDAGTDTTPSGPKGDASGQPKAPPAGVVGRLRLLVPAYFYPGGDGQKEWQKLFDAASKSKAEIVAIANANSGPGADSDASYKAIVAAAGRAGVTVVGYVSTGHGSRPLAEIKRDVDDWVLFYPKIRGVFFDQQPADGQYVASFAELRDYVKQKLPDPLVITNPGALCDEAYLAKNVSDVTCVFSNYKGFDSFWLPAPLKSYEPNRFAAMAYDIPDAETMRKLVNFAFVRGIGYIYITDAKRTNPNPWGKLPAYWEAEVDAVTHVR